MHAQAPEINIFNVYAYAFAGQWPVATGHVAHADADQKIQIPGHEYDNHHDWHRHNHCYKPQAAID